MTKPVTAQKFNSMQLEAIIDKVVLLISSDEDQEFFRGVLWIKAEESPSSAHFSRFVASLLNANQAAA